MSSYLFNAMLGTIFAKLLPFVVPLLILLGALLFADRFIDLIYRALGTRK
ncbi:MULTISPECIES: hypothetical protein [Bacillus cereus group]|nr:MULTISPECIES: hypothetical protein [Bacillus cereus group]MED2846871.1 hypothetical protein [Bacillus toyonensis]